MHDPAWGKDAPTVAAEIHFDGEVQAATFLVDTGASSTSINAHSLGNHVKAWNAGGDDESCNGVGGLWPVKRHTDVELVFHLPDGNDIQLTAPLVDLMAPFRDATGRASMVHRRPGRGTPTLNQPCQTPNLLGRDFFRANRLTLFWDPAGDAYIDVVEVPTTRTHPHADDKGHTAAN